MLPSSTARNSSACLARVSWLLRCACNAPETAGLDSQVMDVWRQRYRDAEALAHNRQIQAELQPMERDRGLDQSGGLLAAVFPEAT